jgi:hypothetical protein
LDWAHENFDVTYTSPSDTFTIENQQDHFIGDTRNIKTQIVTQSIVLKDAEPYLTYLASQKRWSRTLKEDERKKLAEHVQQDIEKEISEKGSFEELSINGIVIVTRI